MGGDGGSWERPDSERRWTGEQGTPRDEIGIARARESRTGRVSKGKECGGEGTAMKRPVGWKPAELRIVTALEEGCPVCGAKLYISQHRDHWVERLDGCIHLVRRDKRCRAEGFPGPHPVFHELVLPPQSPAA